MATFEWSYGVLPEHGSILPIPLREMAPPYFLQNHHQLSPFICAVKLQMSFLCAVFVLDDFPLQFRDCCYPLDYPGRDFL